MVFAARTGSGEDGERQERGAARTESGEDGDTSESGEDGESGEVHLTRPKGATCGGGWGRAEGSEMRRGGGAWRAERAQERAAWK